MPSRAAGAFCCAASSWLCVVAVVALQVTLHFDAVAIQVGFQPAPARELAGDRKLSDDDLDDLRKEREDATWVHLIGPLAQLAIFLIVAVISCLTCYIHWSCYIKPTPDKYVPRHVVMPEQLTGSFKYGAFDCFSELGTCCCFTWCTSCMMADLWYRAGWLHASMGTPGPKFNSYDASCPGWRWFLGAGGHCCLVDVAGCFTPCFIAALRGGVGFIDGGDGGLGDVTPFRQMFRIVPHGGFSTFCSDCCLICWCGPCAGTQEYRQVMAALDAGPLEVRSPAAAPPGAQIVGQPVYAGAPVVGQPVAVGNEQGAAK